MNSLTMLGQLEAFHARVPFDNDELLREAIEHYVCAQKWPCLVRDVMKDLDLSERQARDHLYLLTKQNRIKQLSTRPMSWTRIDK